MEYVCVSINIHCVRSCGDQNTILYMKQGNIPNKNHKNAYKSTDYNFGHFDLIMEVC